MDPTTRPELMPIAESYRRLVAAVESAPYAFSPWLADQIREPVLREALG